MNGRIGKQILDLKTVRRALWYAALASSLSAPTLAQESPEATSHSDRVLDQVIVTARKREESLQDTPIAISAFNAATLERQEITSTADLSSIAPNLQFKAYGPLTGNNSAAQVFIRGIGQSDASSGVDPGVGMYIDEVYMGRSVGGVMEFRDIAGVQVLRGPQGTLFGRNTIGGAVLLTTTLPGHELGGVVRVGIGEDRLKEAFAAIDLPLGENLAGRFSAGARSRDGYVTRTYDGTDLGNENTLTLQTSWVFEATEDLSLTLRGDYTRNDENGSPFVFAAVNGGQAFPAAISRGSGCPGATFPPPFVPQNIVDERCANDATWKLGPFTNGGTAPVESKLTNWGTSLVANWQLNDTLTFKSISAYRELAWSGKRDADNTALLILHTDYESDGHQFSEELQALIEVNKLHGVVGAFYFKESITDFLQVPFAAPPAAVAAGGAAAGSRDYQRAVIDNDNAAVFTQWSFDATDTLSITGGVRYTKENKGVQIVAYTITPQSLPNPAVLPTTAPPLNVLPIPFEQSFSAVTGSASIQYRWNDALMTYVSWSQGFKSGGFNQRFNAPPPGYAPTPFSEERAETYELGFKSQFNDQLRLNGALFQTKYQDMQLIYRVGVVPLLFNAGEASIKGGELELTYVLDNLTIDSSVGYMSNSFDSVTAVPGATATVGPNNSLPFSPKWQGSFGIGYGFYLKDSYKLTPHVTVVHTGNQFFDAANSTEVGQLSDVTVLNASLSFASVEAQWQIKASVNNLTDKLYPVAGNSSYGTSAGYAEIIYARPRTFNLSASLKF